MESSNENEDGTNMLSQRCLQMDSIKVKFFEQFGRKPCPSLDTKLDEMWEKITAQNPRLYNASKYRIHGVSVDEKGSVVMEIGMTDYKQTVCTHFELSLEKQNELFRYGEEQFRNKHACFANPIGVSAVVVTNDQYVIVIKRATSVAEAKGKMDTVGGHAEPGEMLKKLNIDDSDIFNVDGKDVLYEIFHSMVREVRDEVNVPETSLSWPLLLGIIRNKDTALKPCFIFFVSCNLPKDDIAELYAAGGPETDESTELSFIPVKKIESYSTRDFLEMRETWSLCGQATLLYYHQHLKNS